MIYNTSLVIQLLLMAVVVVAAESFGLWFIHHKMVIPAERMAAATWVYQMAVLSFSLVIMQVPYSSIILARERMDFYAMVSVLDAALKLGIVLLLPWLNSDRLIGYGLLLTMVSLIDFLLYFGYAKHHFEEIRLLRTSLKKYMGEILSFSGWNIFGSFSYMMREQGVDVMMNLFFGPVVNAARGIANQVNAGLQSFVGNMTTAIRPQVIQSYAAGHVDRTLQLTFSISKLSCAVLFLMAAPIMLEIDQILQIWLGDTIPDHTVGFLYVIILISMVNNLNSAISGVIHATGQMMVYQVVTSVISLSGVPAAYVALRMGVSPEVALLIVGGFVTISQCASVIILKRIVPEFSVSAYLGDVVGRLLLMMGISLPALWLVHQSMTDGLIRLIVMLLAAGAIVLPVGYVVLLNKSEKQLCKEVLQKKIRK